MDTKLPTDESKPDAKKTQEKGISNKKMELMGHVDPPIEYDMDPINTMLELVYPQELDQDEFVLAWMAKSRSISKPMVPGYPVIEEKFLEKLPRISAPRALYVSMSTSKQHTDGKHYNRKALFKQLCLVILDDIGAKIPLDRLPPDLIPTIIVQSSPGNYQYGYVFEKPISDYVAAEALITVVKDSGYTDAGGMTPTKLIRLPGGVNGKPGKNRLWPVTLEKYDGPLWTPKRFLEVLDKGISWDDILKDAECVNKNRPPESYGTSKWSPVSPKSPGLNGIIDPVLEHLIERGDVIQDNGEWVTVRCPRYDEHSTGDYTAGYSPLGRGEGHENKRGFHCFHEHVNPDTKLSDPPTTREFLDFVVANGGPEAGVNDSSGELVSTYAFDYSANVVWNVRTPRMPNYIEMTAFKNKYPANIKYTTPEGKIAAISEVKAYLISKGRVVVEDRIFDPTTNDKIVTHNGVKYVNLFTRPDYGKGVYDQHDIDMFLAFIKYLIPHEDEQEYFLDWLAAKVQNMGFRGPAIMMVAPKQGTGRTTLGDMISMLIGVSNAINVPFKQLISDGDFNEFQEFPLVITNESKDCTGDQPVSYHKVYERLKDTIDPRPKRIEINTKYGRKRMSMVHSSYLMFSQHNNALALSDNDRRFYVIQNVYTPAPPQYFMDLNAWLEKTDEGADKPGWINSVGKWLTARKVDMKKLLTPPALTEAKKEMSKLSKNALDIAVDTIVDTWEGTYISAHIVKGILMRPDIEIRLNTENYKNFNNAVNAHIRACTLNMHPKLALKINTQAVRPRIIPGRLTSTEEEKNTTRKTTTPNFRKEMRDSIMVFDAAKIEQSVLDALSLADM